MLIFFFFFLPVFRVVGRGLREGGKGMACGKEMARCDDVASSPSFFFCCCGGRGNDDAVVGFVTTKGLNNYSA